jgi:hypothetical protein
MQRREVVRMLEDHQRERRNEELRIWTLLGLEIWQRRFKAARPTG